MVVVSSVPRQAITVIDAAVFVSQGLLRVLHLEERTLGRVIATYKLNTGARGVDLMFNPPHALFTESSGMWSIAGMVISFC